MSTNLLLDTKMKNVEGVYHCNTCLMHFVENRFDVCDTCKLIEINRAAGDNAMMVRRIFIIGIILGLALFVIAVLASIKSV